MCQDAKLESIPNPKVKTDQQYFIPSRKMKTLIFKIAKTCEFTTPIFYSHLIREHFCLSFLRRRTPLPGGTGSNLTIKTCNLTTIKTTCFLIIDNREFLWTSWIVCEILEHMSIFMKKMFVGFIRFSDWVSDSPPNQEPLLKVNTKTFKKSCCIFATTVTKHTLINPIIFSDQSGTNVFFIVPNRQ